MTVFIKGGTKCMLSVIGHYNFFYPSQTKSANVSHDVEGEAMSWTGGGDNLSPIKIPIEALDVDFVLSKRDNPEATNAVVWIEKSSLDKISD
tara:strand:- start:18 stop:293 length:276 start_codon:yes stop_codon:yes gene_type:complete